MKEQEIPQAAREFKAPDAAFETPQPKPEGLKDKPTREASAQQAVAELGQAQKSIEAMDTTPDYATIIDRLEQSGELQELFTRTIERIRDETTFLDEAREFGIDQGILEGFPDQKVGNIPIEWGATDLQDKAEYTKRPKIRIKAEKPNAKKILQTLLEKGKMPIGIRAILDGAAHYHHQPQGLGKLWSKQTKELGMAFKMIVHQALNGDKNTPEERQRNMRRVSGYGKDREQAIPDGQQLKAKEAIKTIEGLLALGYKAKDIGVIVRKSGAWKTRTHSFGEPTNVLHQEMQAAQLDEDGLQERIATFHDNRNRNREAAIKIVKQALKI